MSRHRRCECRCRSGTARLEHGAHATPKISEGTKPAMKKRGDVQRVRPCQRRRAALNLKATGRNISADEEREHRQVEPENEDRVEIAARREDGAAARRARPGFCPPQTGPRVPITRRSTVVAQRRAAGCRLTKVETVRHGKFRPQHDEQAPTRRGRNS